MRLPSMRNHSNIPSSKPHTLIPTFFKDINISKLCWNLIECLMLRSNDFCRVSFIVSLELKRQIYDPHYASRGTNKRAKKNKSQSVQFSLL